MEEEQALLGMAGYLHLLVPDCSTVVAPFSSWLRDPMFMISE